MFSIRSLVFPPVLFLISLLAVACAGCGSGPRMVEVEGVLMLNDEEVPNAAITFQPIAGGPIGAANTDAQGRFKLITGNRNGIIPGKYRVAVTKYEVLNIDMSKPGDFSTLDEQWIVPQRYSQMDTTDIVIELNQSKRDLELKLTD